MDILEEIYRSTSMSEVDAVQVQEMEMKLNVLTNRVKEKEMKEREEISEVLYEASQYGEYTGFIDGFRYAVMLMSQCYF